MGFFGHLACFGQPPKCDVAHTSLPICPSNVRHNDADLAQEGYMAPKPEPPLIGAVEDKKAVGGRHKQPGRLAFVSWATIRRIYDIGHAAFWALAVAFVAVVIINIPQISEAPELQRVQEISEENSFYCTKWGLRANTHEHLICMMDLDAIRARSKSAFPKPGFFRTTQPLQ